MKSFLKMLVGIFVLLLLGACEDPEVLDHASVNITNLSDYPANVWLYNYGSNSTITAEVSANSDQIITINDGDAGINVHGGRTIIDYKHLMNFEEVDEISSTYADINTNQMTEVNIDNPFGCLDIFSYSQSSFINISFDDNNYEIIEPWGELTKFFDPEDNSITKSFSYFGLTFFENEIEVEIFKDDYTRLNIYPDAGCIVVKNISETSNIVEVYLRPPEVTDWGENQLIDVNNEEIILNFDGFLALTCTDSIDWDILIRDDENNDFDAMNFYLDNDEILEFYFDGNSLFRQPLIDNRKKTTNINKLSRTEKIRIERNYIPNDLIEKK